MKLVAVFLLASFSLLAAPSFQGTFKLNVSKSDFGQFPAPISMTQEVTHQDPSLKSVTKMSSDRGDFEFVFACSTDGKECTNEFGRSSMKSTMKWDGEALVVEGKGTFGDNDVTMSDRWELSADGTVLTISRKWSSVQGDLVQKLVLEKQ